MGVKIGNFVQTTLANATNGSQTTMVVSSVSGFPSITVPGSDYFRLTLVTVAGAKEIVKVTDVTGTTITVTRAEEGTVGLSLSAGDAVGLRLTRQTILDLFAEEAAARAAAIITESQFGALTIPASALKDDIIALRHITDGLLTGAKLNAAVAGQGLAKDGSGNLRVNVDGTKIAYSSSGAGDEITVKPASIEPSDLLYGKQTAFASYNVGGTGTGQFYTGTRPWTTYGNAGSGARIVMVQIQNDHATQVAQIGIRIGGTLGYYEGTDSDTGVLIVNAFRIDDTSTRGTFSKAMSFTFLVPPGHHWLFENQTSGTGTPNLVYHNYIELR